MKEIGILLIGNDGVGKTTLILSLISEDFVSKVPRRSEEISIPADVNAERIPSRIIDSCNSEQSEENLCDVIRAANVIIVVYAVNDPISIEAVSEKWLPLIRSVNHDVQPEDRTPVVLAGNKSDLSSLGSLDKAYAIMSSFPEIETCLECSAKCMQNVSEMFWYSQKAVLYPTSPLYSADKKDLTENAKNTLTRIFRICDKDNDGYINDRELEMFQDRCFQTPLSPQSLQDVKQMIGKHTIGCVTPNGLTLNGFLYLHNMLIQKGRHETTWTVFRKFGYDNKLCLKNEFLSAKVTISRGSSTELSKEAFDFLTMLFNKYDEDADGYLSSYELNNLFVTCPKPLWNYQSLLSVAVSEFGHLNVEAFLSLWVLLSYRSPSDALEYLVYLGFTYEYDGAFDAGAAFCSTSTSDIDFPNNNQYQHERRKQHPITPSQLLRLALNVTRDKRIDLHKNQTERNVFFCRVYGANKVGKSCFIQGLLNRSISQIAALKVDVLPELTCAPLAVNGDMKYLILNEIDAGWGEQMPESEALQCDVAALLYDTADHESFKYVADLYLAYYRGIQRRVPCILVACKSDQIEVPQYYSLDPYEFSAKYRLPIGEPLKFSCFHLPNVQQEHHRAKRSGRSSRKVSDRRPKGSKAAGDCGGSFEPIVKHDVYLQLLITANYPHLRGMQLSTRDFTWKLTLAATVLAGFGFLAFRISRTHI